MARVRGSVLKNSASLVCLGIALSAAPAFANPTGGQVSSGSATITNPSSSKTVVKQSTQGVVINWKSFDIANGQVTQFVQPNAKAVAVNRIGGQNASQILGTLSANGRVVLINPNGIAFGKGSKVNVGALIATTTDGSDNDLLAGKFTKAGSATGYVTNAGRITANGTVALVAPGVSNSGVVNAKVGSVSLGGTNKFTVDFAGDGLVSFAAGDASKASVNNTGKITGANVSMTTRVAEGLATAVVNTGGIVTATGVNRVGGNITLDAGLGGTINVTGAKLVASGKNGGGNVTIGGWNHIAVTVDKASSIDTSATGRGNAGNVSVIGASATVKGSIAARGGKGSGNGGKIETSGDTVDFNGAHIDAGAKHGSSGQWLLDPVDITVDATGAATIMSALATSDVALVTELDNVHTTQILYDTIPGYTPVETSGPGDFYLKAPITWSSSHQLQIGANHSVYLYAPITVAGSGTLQILDNYSNNGSGGILDIAAPINFLQPASGHLNINGFNFTLETSFASLVTDANANPAGYFALASDLDASGTTYTTAPITAIGLSSSGVNNINLGILEGLGHTISGLTVQTSGSNNAALIGTVYAAGTVENLHLSNVNVSSTGSGIAAGLAAVSNQYSILTNASSSGTVSSKASAGGLIGHNSGTITLSWSSADVTGVSVGRPTGTPALPAAGIGGFVAWNNGLITNSYATGDVSGSGDYLMIGGFAGLNWTTISNSYATGNVLATGGFTFGILSEGGFVGDNPFDVDHSYATGSVTAMGLTNASSAQIGGFSGRQDSTGAILDNVYASGHISAPSTSGVYVGGIAGGNPNVVKNSVWDIDSTGVGVAVGVGPAATNTVSVNASTRYTASAYTPFTFTLTGGTPNAWVIIDPDSTRNGNGLTRPMLASEYSLDIVNAHQLQLTLMNVTANYYVTSDFDASGTGSGTDIWSSAGFLTVTNESTSNFSGNVDGLGSVISNLTIAGGQSDVAVFGRTSGTISNLEFLNPTVTSFGSSSYVGVVVGRAFGPITNVNIVGGSVSAQGSSPIVGGLVGEAWSSVTDSYSTAAINAGTSAVAGGLVGWVRGGSILQSFATGAVTVGAGSYAGGFAGLNSGNIVDAFALGNVIASGGAAAVGGLIGYSEGLTSNSFSTGMVSAGGGAIGSISGGTTTNVYWDTETSGLATDNGGATGETTAQLQASLLPGLDDGNWSQVAGVTFPYLTWLLPSGTPQAVSALIYQDHGVTAAANADAHVMVNGSALDPVLSFTGSAANGYYYTLLSPGAVPNNSQLLVYSNTLGSGTYLQSVAGSQFNVALDRGYLREVTSVTSVSAINAGFATALGSNALTFHNREIDELGSAVLNIDSSINVGTGNLILSASGGVLQNVGTIVANGLLLLGNGDFSLGDDNQISTLAANTGSGLITLSDTAALTIGSIFSTSGVTTASRLFLLAPGLTVTRPIKAASTVLSLSGALSATAQGGITTNSITGTTTGGISLTGTNHIGQLFFLQNNGGGNVTVVNDGSLYATGLNAGSGRLSLTTTSGDITIGAYGIAAGTKITLNSAHGIFEDSPYSSIASPLFSGTSHGDALFTAANYIGTITDATTNGGAFSFVNAGKLAVTGPVDAGIGNVSFDVQSGNLSISDMIKGGIVTLITEIGRIAEAGVGYINASTLNVSAGSGILLTSPQNTFTTLGTDQTASGPNTIVKSSM